MAISMPQPAHRTRLLILSHERIGPKMAGPGIRCHALAGVMARHAQVCLAMPAGSTLPDSGAPFEAVQFEPGQWGTIERQVREANVILLPSDMAWHFPTGRVHSLAGNRRLRSIDAGMAGHLRARI